MKRNKTTHSQQWLNVATETAQKAGGLILHYYHQSEIGMQNKAGDARDLVTTADLESDLMIRSALCDAFPDHVILSEEAYQDGDEIDDTIPTWLVDPVDGTSNFAHGLPWFAVSIALYYAGQIQVAVVYAPLMKFMFMAIHQQGAKLNGEPIHVTTQTDIRQAIFACDWPREQALRDSQLRALTSVAEYAHTIRSLGSASLNLAAVAAGWLDIYFNYSLMPWDTAAGSLILQEAGGHITALDGAAWQITDRRILASNRTLHQEAQSIIGS